MVFKIKTTLTGKLPIYRLKQEARQFIVLCQKDATDKAMDKYLQENYDTTLVGACLDIIDGAKYLTNTTNTIFISFLDKKLDKLASIITFGPGTKVLGSNILRLAFEQI